MCLFCWTQRMIFWRMWETEQVWGTIDFHSMFFPTMEVNGAPKQPGYKLSSKYLPLCSAEQRHSYRFGTTWGWVNDDRIFIFGWTIPLRASFDVFLTCMCWIMISGSWESVGDLESNTHTRVMMLVSIKVEQTSLFLWFTDAASLTLEPPAASSHETSDLTRHRREALH